MRTLYYFIGKHCLFCGKTLDPWDADLCPACRDLSMPVPENSIGPQDTLPGRKALFCFDGPVRTGIHRFKYDGDRVFGAVFGSALAKEDLPNLPPDAIVTCVPKAKRGSLRIYNQSKVLANAYAKQAKLRLEPRLLAKHSGFRSQTEMSSVKQRIENAKNAYYAGPDIRRCAGKTVILANDVLTTGATASACEAILKKAGAKTVLIRTVAKTVRSSEWRLKFCLPELSSLRLKSSDPESREKLHRLADAFLRSPDPNAEGASASVCGMVRRK